MNEDLLFAYSLQDGDFVQWVMRSPPLLLDRVIKALVILARLDGSSQFADLLACRDAAHTLYTIACEGGFDDVASVFLMQYDFFSRALLPFSDERA